MKDARSTRAIDVALAFGRGEASIEELKAAGDVAYTYAAYANVAYAANAAYVAVNAAAAAAYAVYAVYAADAADARSKVLKQCADIVREYYPEPPSLSKGG